MIVLLVAARLRSLRLVAETCSGTKVDGCMPVRLLHMERMQESVRSDEQTFIFRGNMQSDVT